MEEPKSTAKRRAKTVAAAQEDKITLLPLSELHDFPNHPFKVRDDEAMQETAESIRQYGVLVPAIVRPREDGGYEIIAGHRRRHGSELAGLSTICPHFHLSLQSGCDETLRRMNRHYTTDDYAGRCEILRKYFDNPAITTDVIVGFPGETAEEFETTKRYLERVHFYEMHVFKYSKRAGTKAAVMEDQVPEQVKAVRSDELLALTERMSREYRESFLGQEKEVLLEEKVTVDGVDYLAGYTKEYVRAAVPWDETRKGTMITGYLDGFLTEEIINLLKK